MDMSFDEEKAKKNLSEMLDKMQKDTDLLLLNKYKKLFKKGVPLFSRRWVAAWLFMYYDQREGPQGGYEKRQHDSNNFTALNNDECKQLFFSVGKNRRLHSKELAAFISSKTSAEREDIGMIRVLDNYSFAQIKSEKAEEVIEKLNGEVYKGRPITVNYAKSKDPRA